MGEVKESAYVSLRDVPKPDALADLARSALTDERDEAAVRARATELDLETCKTSWGDAVAVLARGPEDDAERVLARALGALAVAQTHDLDEQAALAVRLAASTPFDPSAYLDEALGDRGDALFERLVTLVGTSTPRERVLLIGALLQSSKRPAAKKHLEAFTKDADPLVRGVLVRERLPEERLAGELMAPPRHPVLTVLLGVTGVLFVVAAVRLVMRFVLAYRCPAEVVASASGVRVRVRTELLGRTLQDREIVIGADALARAVREVRFPRLGLYAGLLALALGTFVGVGALVDGVRAASPSLLVWGLGIVLAGVALDLVLSSLRFGAVGECRVVLSPTKGRPVCVGYVDPKRADATLVVLARR